MIFVHSATFYSPAELMHDLIHRRCFQVGAVSTRRVPHEPTESTFPHKDIPSEYWWVSLNRCDATRHLFIECV